MLIRLYALIVGIQLLVYLCCICQILGCRWSRSASLLMHRIFATQTAVKPLHPTSKESLHVCHLYQQRGAYRIFNFLGLGLVRNISENVSLRSRSANNFQSPVRLSIITCIVFVYLLLLTVDMCIFAFCCLNLFCSSFS